MIGYTYRFKGFKLNASLFFYIYWLLKLWYSGVRRIERDLRESPKRLLASISMHGMPACRDWDTRWFLGIFFGFLMTTGRHCSANLQCSSPIGQRPRWLFDNNVSIKRASWRNLQPLGLRGEVYALLGTPWLRLYWFSLPQSSDAPPTPSYPFGVPKRYYFRLVLKFLRDRDTEGLSLKLRIF